MTTGLREAKVTVTLTEQFQGSGVAKRHRDWARFRRDQQLWNQRTRNRQDLSGISAGKRKRGRGLSSLKSQIALFGGLSFYTSLKTLNSSYSQMTLPSECQLLPDASAQQDLVLELSHGIVLQQHGLPLAHPALKFIKASCCIYLTFLFFISANNLETSFLFKIFLFMVLFF